MTDTAVIETMRVRQLASSVLDRLLVDRVESEIRLAEHGVRDPMKAVTGRSAMDAAVVTTRQMISRMDAMLASYGPDRHTEQAEQLEAIGAFAAGAAR